MTGMYHDQPLTELLLLKQILLVTLCSVLILLAKCCSTVYFTESQMLMLNNITRGKVQNNINFKGFLRSRKVVSNFLFIAKKQWI